MVLFIIIFLFNVDILLNKCSFNDFYFIFFSKTFFMEFTSFNQEYNEDYYTMDEEPLDTFQYPDLESFKESYNLQQFSSLPNPNDVLQTLPNEPILFESKPVDTYQLVNANNNSFVNPHVEIVDTPFATLQRTDNEDIDGLINNINNNNTLFKFERKADFIKISFPTLECKFILNKSALKNRFEKQIYDSCLLLKITNEVGGNHFINFFNYLWLLHNSNLGINFGDLLHINTNNNIINEDLVNSITNIQNILNKNFLLKIIIFDYSNMTLMGNLYDYDSQQFIKQFYFTVLNDQKKGYYIFTNIFNPEDDTIFTKKINENLSYGIKATENTFYNEDSFYLIPSDGMVIADVDLDDNVYTQMNYNLYSKPTEVTTKKFGKTYVSKNYTFPIKKESTLVSKKTPEIDMDISIRLYYGLDGTLSRENLLDLLYTLSQNITIELPKIDKSINVTEDIQEDIFTFKDSN